MKPRLPDSPAKLALLSAICLLIVGLFFLIPGSRLAHSPVFGAYLIFCIITVPVCTILPFKFVTDLRHGIEDERWTEAQLEPLRARLESPFYTALGIGLPVALLILEFPLKHPFGDLGVAWFGFLYWLLYEFRIVLKRPPSSAPPNQWHDSAPSHSDHSGQR